MELIIFKHGMPHTILYDECDLWIIEKYNWRVSNKGYVVADVYASGVKREIRLHRIIMDATDPCVEVDHIHHNKLDNRRSELRICDHGQNMRNRRSASTGASMYLGVSVRNDKRYKNKIASYYVAQIKTNGRRIRLGQFKIEKEAARAYDAAAKIYHGEFANLNFK